MLGKNVSRFEVGRQKDDHELEISFFHIALKKFAVKNGLKLYWQQSDLKHTISPDAMFALTDPRSPKTKAPFIISWKSSGQRSDIM